jgi:ribosomal protein S18 acetylase RimI-like enzyme
MVPIAVRKAKVADSEGIARLVSDLGYPTTAGQMGKRLEPILRDGSYETLVACDDGQIVGFVGTRIGSLYEDDVQYGQIMALAVATEYQRRGIGRMLIHAAESGLVARGARILVVNSGNQRADAHAFYENLGYRFTGRRYKKKYLESPRREVERPGSNPPKVLISWLLGLNSPDEDGLLS